MKLLRKLQDNRLLRPIGDAMTTGEVIIIGELMTTGQAEMQSVKTSHDGGIDAAVGSPLCLLTI